MRYIIDRGKREGMARMTLAEMKQAADDALDAADALAEVGRPMDEQRAEGGAYAAAMEKYETLTSIWRKAEKAARNRYLNRSGQ